MLVLDIGILHSKRRLVKFGWERILGYGYGCVYLISAFSNQLLNVTEDGKKTRDLSFVFQVVLSPHIDKHRMCPVLPKA